MQFGRALPRLFRHIVRVEPALELVLLSKVDLTSAYMRVWVCPEDISRLKFVIPFHPYDTQNLISFHLYLPMRYVNSAPYVLCTREADVDLANSRWGGCTSTLPHRFYALAVSTPTISEDAHIGLPSEALYASLSNLCTQLLLASCTHLLHFINV